MWIKKTGNKVVVGSTCGCRKPTGYWEIRFNKKEYLAHRVIIFLAKGLDTTTIVDHRDGDPSNNRIDNLREAQPWQNSSNSKEHLDKEGTLPKGIYEDKRKPGCLFASVCHKGKRYTKGSKDLQSLIGWLSDKRKALHGEYSNRGTHGYKT